VLNSWHDSHIIVYTYGALTHRSRLNFKTMYFTKGIEAVATITELRSKTSDLVEHAKSIEHGILIQKNNEPYAVLISYDVYEKLLKASVQAAARKK
jgi:prevent-host-death family protein